MKSLPQPWLPSPVLLLVYHSQRRRDFPQFVTWWGIIAHLSSVIEDEKNHLSMKLGIGKVNILQKLDLLQTAVLRLE